MRLTAWIAALAACCFCTNGIAQDPLTITTWNIEHLGSPGRGFGGGFGAGKLPLRNDHQLVQIAALIKNELKSDVLVLQEIAINRRYRGASHCRPLDAIKKHLKKLGQAWESYLPPVRFTPPSDDEENIHLAFMWNTKRVKPHSFAELDFRNYFVAGKELFDRRPLIGHFSAIDEDGKLANDFLLVNVHLASGQNNDENHLVAMTMIQHELETNLGRYGVTEVDRAILGDFNDNPHAVDSKGRKMHSPAMYEQMRFKGYVDLVTADMKTTRVSSKLNSLIDHVLVNSEFQEHMPEVKAILYRPDEFDDESDDQQKLTAWRQTFSDHFPISIQIEVAPRDDDSDFFAD